MMGIYQIKNKINGKVYIGQSRDIDKRIKSHFKVAFELDNSAYSYPLMSSIRKYGSDNFEISILEECDESKLNEREIYWIDNKDSLRNGYNQTIGGHYTSFDSLNLDTLNQVTNLLTTTDLIHQEIADRLSISKESVQGINTGRYWKRDLDYPLQKTKHNQFGITEIKQLESIVCIDCMKKSNRKGYRCFECGNIKNRIVKERPNKYDLSKMIYKYGFSGTGRIYNISDNAIKKWCISYNIGRNKKEVIEWYLKNNNM